MDRTLDFNETAFSDEINSLNYLIFDQPLLTPYNNMSIKGSSMFMQYKVNEHFKVETRISISNRPSAPWEP